MSTQPWTYRWHCLVEAAHREAANALWTLVAPGGDPEALSYGAPCSETGKAPISHYAMSTLASSEMVAILQELREVGLPEGLRIAVTANAPGASLDDALREWGLARIQERIE